MVWRIMTVDSPWWILQDHRTWEFKGIGTGTFVIPCQYDYLPDSRIPSGYDPDWTWRQSVQLYRTDFHPANVDEFFASDHCMAEPVGKERSYQQSPSFFHLPALEIINTPYAIVLGMVYDFLPFMILPITMYCPKLTQMWSKQPEILVQTVCRHLQKSCCHWAFQGSSAELPWSLYRHWQLLSSPTS